MRQIPLISYNFNAMKPSSLLFFIFLSFGLFAQPRFIAHRGASWLAPENTVAAANLAWELGAGGVEVDIRLSEDHRVMVIHDEDTRRTCSGKTNFSVSDTPSLVLRELDAGSWKDEKYQGEKLPFLSEIIATLPPGRILFVEIKCGSEVLPHLKRVVQGSGKTDQIVFIGFGWDTILATKEAFPDNACYWLSSRKRGLLNKMEEAAEEGLDGVDLHFGLIDPQVMTHAKSLQLEVFAWTVNDPEEARRLTQLGVSGITTDRPRWLKEKIMKQ